MTTCCYKLTRGDETLASGISRDDALELIGRLSLETSGDGDATHYHVKAGAFTLTPETIGRRVKFSHDGVYACSDYYGHNRMPYPVNGVTVTLDGRRLAQSHWVLLEVEPWDNPDEIEEGLSVDSHELGDWFRDRTITAPPGYEIAVESMHQDMDYLMITLRPKQGLAEPGPSGLGQE